MSTVTLTPTSTLNASFGTKVGGATAHAVLGDGVLTSWIEMWPEAGAARVGFDDPVKPAGSMTKLVRAVAGVASISVNTTKFDVWLEAFGGTVTSLSGVQIAGTDYEVWTTPWVSVGDATAVQLGDMVAGIRRSLTGAATNLRAIEIQFQIIFALQPTVTASQSVSGSSSTVSWLHTPGEDGGLQEWYVANLWTSDGVLLFDTGIVAGSATSVTAHGLASGTYEWRVQTAQNVNGVPHWSAIDTESTTIPVMSRAEVATLTATADALQAVVEVEATRDTGEDDWSGVEIETLYADGAVLPEAVGNIETGTGGVADGWQIETFGTATATAESIEAGGPVGNYQRFSATLNAGAFRQMSNREALPCKPGDTVHMFCRYKAAGAGGGAALIVVCFSDEPPGPRGWDDGGDARFLVQSPLVWTPYHLSAVAPPGTRSVQAGFQFNTGIDGANAVIEFDDVSLVVSSETWAPMRTAATLAADTATSYDYEAPPDRDVFYRARAENVSGAVGAWVYADPVLWEADSEVWFKSPDRPDLNMQLCLAERPRLSRPRQQHVMTILGAEDRVVRADVINSVEWELMVETETTAEAVAFLELVKSSPTLLIQFPPDYDMIGGTSHMWVSVIGVHEEWLSPVLGVPVRVWGLQVVQIGRP